MPPLALAVALISAEKRKSSVGDEGGGVAEVCCFEVADLVSKVTWTF
jgi:hypothetical protein